MQDVNLINNLGNVKCFKSAKHSSLASRLAICMCVVNWYHGGLGVVNQLWGEFVLEMKYCCENICEIKGYFCTIFKYFFRKPSRLANLTNLYFTAV